MCHRFGHHFLFSPRFNSRFVSRKDENIVGIYNIYIEVFFIYLDGKFLGVHWGLCRKHNTFFFAFLSVCKSSLSCLQSACLSPAIFCITLTPICIFHTKSMPLRTQYRAYASSVHSNDPKAIDAARCRGGHRSFVRS